MAKAPSGRTAQLAYSEQMAAMRDEAGRRRKAAKILAVLRHVLGRDEATGLAGLTVADVGCSQGFIADELAGAGAVHTLGVDIDVPGLAVAHQSFGGRVGVVCLGLGNRLGVVEPHHRLPFLSYLPPAAADRYVRATGRAESYHERFRTRPGLRRLLAGWHVLDYTLPVLAEPAAFAGDDLVPGPVSRLPAPALTALLPLLPTYLWVASPSPLVARGGPLRVAPRPV